ncbi:MAG: GDP-L-fucose synthase family protein [Salinispira sp.]
MNKNAKIYVAGHRGMVGAAILRELIKRGYTNIVHKTHSELDLTRQTDVEQFFDAERPEYVFLLAAKVGGIWANMSDKAGFCYENVMIGSNIVHSAYKFGVKKLLNTGSSCIYPAQVAQPIKEEYLLSGPLGETNDGYALAKILVLKLCQYYNENYNTNFLSVMPPNLFGSHDNFDLKTSHVLPALIRKIHDAKIANQSVTLWGDGSPYREFMYVDDAAQASLFIMENYTAADIGGYINIGTGKEIMIKDLAQTIARIVGFKGEITWDTTKPNGTPRKLLSIEKLTKLGWKHSTSLNEGIHRTYNWFLEHYGDICE